MYTRKLNHNQIKRVSTSSNRRATIKKIKQLSSTKAFRGNALSSEMPPIANQSATNLPPAPSCHQPFTDWLPAEEPEPPVNEASPASSHSRKELRDRKWAKLLESMPKAYLEGIGNQQLRAEDMEVVRHVKGEATCICEKSQKWVTCVFVCGVKHVMFEYCNTHSPLPLLLLRRHLFPLTPSTPGNAIHLELMRAIHHLHYLCRLSIHGIATFCGAFNRRKIPVSFKNRLSEALPMYDRMMLNVEKQYRIDCGLIKACPGCKFVNGRKGISADGNFQLRRLKRAKDTPDVVYKGSEEVDNYWVDTIVEYGSTRTDNEVKGCTSFTALEKKGGNLNGLDQTGVFGITCDHGFPLAFVDMTTPGEQFKYVLSALNKVIANPLYGGNVRIMYDVGCKIQKAITTTPCLHAIKDAPISVGIFHITGHVPECQVKFHPRLLQGFGLRDGEWMERLWSYLNGFVSMTRYMSPLNRRLTLTVALDTFAQQKSANIAHTLQRKYKRANDVKADAVAALRRAGFDEDLRLIEQKWRKHLHEATQLREHDETGQIAKVQNAWENLRLAVGVYDIITEAFRTQGNGHNETQNLSRHKETAFKEVEKKLTAYQNIRALVTVIGLPPLPTIGSVLERNSIFRQTANILMDIPNYPFDAYHGKLRAEEELRMLKEDARSVLRSNEETVTAIQETIRRLHSPPPPTTPSGEPASLTNAEESISLEDHGKIALYKQKLEEAAYWQQVHSSRLQCIIADTTITASTTNSPEEDQSDDDEANEPQSDDELVEHDDSEFTSLFNAE